MLLPLILLLFGSFDDSVQDNLVNYVYKGMKDPAKLETAAVRANEGETGANMR